MRRSLAILAAASLVILNATFAAAQERTTRVPDRGMTAIGMSIGAVVPTDNTLKNGIDIAANAERYLTPRLSVRGKLSGAWMDVTGHSFNGDARPLYATGNMVYNWEGGAWHPYLTSGLGFYRYRFTDNRLTGADNKFGVNAGGGVEWFATRHDTFTWEFAMHVLPGQVRSPMASYDPSFWTLSAGYKKYFSK